MGNHGSVIGARRIQILKECNGRTKEERRNDSYDSWRESQRHAVNGRVIRKRLPK